MQENNVLIKFNLIGVISARKYLRISNNLLFDFRRGFFFAKINAENFDVALDIAKRDFIKLAGYIALRKQIGFEETGFCELRDKQILTDYSAILGKGIRYKIFEDILKIRTPYYMQASKYINSSYILIKHPVEHFNNLFKAIEVIGGYFVDDINQGLARKLKAMSYSKLMTKCEKGGLTRPGLTATSDLTIDKVLKQKLKLNDGTIKYIKEIRTHRNQFTAHGVLTPEIWHLALLNYVDIDPSVMNEPRPLSYRMNQKYKVIVDLLFLKFTKYLFQKSI